MLLKGENAQMGRVMKQDTQSREEREVHSENMIRAKRFPAPRMAIQAPPPHSAKTSAPASSF